MAFATGALSTDQTMFGGFTSTALLISGVTKWALAVNWDLPAGKASDFTVRLATTAALPSCDSNATVGVGHLLTARQIGKLTIDGADVAGDRILVKNQANPVDNGIYLVGATGDGETPWALVRATDFDQTAEIIGGKYVGVTEGVANAGKQFVLTGSGTQSVDVASLVFSSPVPIGTFTIEASDDSTDGSNGHWAATGITFDRQPTGAAASDAIQRTELFKYVRVRWTPTSGDGLCNINYATI